MSKERVHATLIKQNDSPFFPLFLSFGCCPLFVAEKNHWILYIRISYQHHKQYSVFSLVVLIHEVEFDAIKWLARFAFSLLVGWQFFLHLLLSLWSILCEAHSHHLYFYYYSVFVIRQIYRFRFGFAFAYLNVLTLALTSQYQQNDRQK